MIFLASDPTTVQTGVAYPLSGQRRLPLLPLTIDSLGSSAHVTLRGVSVAGVDGTMTLDATVTAGTVNPP